MVAYSVCGHAGSCLLTVNGLGVVSLRVVEPIRPLLDLHPSAWADPESARRRLSPPRKTPRTLLMVMVKMTVKMMVVIVQSEVNHAGTALSLSSAWLAHCSDRRPMI